jgi:DNA transformation protein and related proteins
VSTDSVAEFVVEGLAPLGLIAIRKFFGGRGIYLNGQIIGMVMDDELYLKTNEQTRSLFEVAGMTAFTYVKKTGVTIVRGFYRAPAEIYEDSDELLKWGLIAKQAATPPKPKKRIKK